MIRFGSLASLVGRVCIVATNKDDLIVITVVEKLKYLGQRRLLNNCVSTFFRHIQTTRPYHLASETASIRDRGVSRGCACIALMSGV